MWPSTVWSIQRYHFYRCYKFTGSLPPRPGIVSVRILGNEAAAFATIALVFVIYERAPISASSEIGDTAWNVKFTNVTFIVTRTFSRCCQSPLARSLARATHRSVWALFYDGKPSNADRFTRKRLFALFRCACGRPIRRRNNEPKMGRRSLSRFSVRKLPAWRIMAASIVSPAASAIHSSGFRWPEPTRWPVNFQLAF